eukprot:1195903-Prorocentrum_minimum.AAC.2
MSTEATDVLVELHAQQATAPACPGVTQMSHWSHANVTIGPHPQWRGPDWPVVRVSIAARQALESTVGRPMASKAFLAVDSGACSTYVSSLAAVREYFVGSQMHDVALLTHCVDNSKSACLHNLGVKGKGKGGCALQRDLGAARPYKVRTTPGVLCQVLINDQIG